MQKKYSWYSLLKAGFANQDWDKAIPSSKPKSKYDIIIVGGGLMVHCIVGVYALDLVAMWTAAIVVILT